MRKYASIRSRMKHAVSLKNWWMRYRSATIKCIELRSKAGGRIVNVVGAWLGLGKINRELSEHA